MITLYPYEIPVATSLVKLAQGATDPLTKYMCLWSGFDNIYTTIADRRGVRPILRVDGDGEPKRTVRGEVRVWLVEAPREAEKLQIVFEEFSENLRKNLVEHNSTRFFAYRTPKWRGQDVEVDADGQTVNGVINVGRTVDPRRPVWSPISVDAYEMCMGGSSSDEHLDLISSQILWLLYTVRNNIMHGGKRADDANDIQVAKHAGALLQVIVDSFID